MNKFKENKIKKTLIFFIILITFILPTNINAFTIGKPITIIPSNSLNSGLVGWWTLDGKNLINNVSDTSGNNNHGYMRNFTSTSTAVDMGVIGQSLKLDGSDDIVDIKTPASLLITNATISTRFKTSNAGSSYRGLITKARRFNVFLKDNKLAVFDWNVGDAYLSGGTYNDNKWHTVTVTFQTGVTNGSSIYVDGQFLSNFTWNVYASGNCYVAIGGQDTNCAGLLGSNFNGLLDDARVWNRILSASEVKQIHNQGASKISSVISGLPSTGINSGLLGYWTLDGNKINWATGAVMIHQATISQEQLPICPRHLLRLLVFPDKVYILTVPMMR